MTERREPYTTANKPRQPWPGESAAPSFTPPLGVFSEVDRLRQRIAALEAALRQGSGCTARAVCGAYRNEMMGSLSFAIEELGRVLGEVE